MKIDFIADTNFLIYLHEGNQKIEPFLNYNFGISFITEVELLGFKNIQPFEEKQLKLLIEDCHIVEWQIKIKQQTILLRQKYSIKLPDSIIAATALVYDAPLITADSGFSKIKELDLILLEI